MTIAFGIPDPPEYTCCVCGNTLAPRQGTIRTVKGEKRGYCSDDCLHVENGQSLAGRLFCWLRYVTGRKPWTS